ncbi:MAG: N-acetyltransferase [Gammaproteobacteria bacterium]|nr:N-acetyltransferase [Gammaproteobacteria bacterium]
MVDGDIREGAAADAEAIARIYNHYILNTIVTFEEVPVSGEVMAPRMAAVHAAGMPWLVLEVEGRILGYAYASSWKARSAYRYTAEATVYLDAAATGRGYGKRLYSVLLARLKTLGMHAVVGSIGLPNEASVGLHESCGFIRAALFPEVGFKFGRWVDVGIWQLLL